MSNALMLDIVPLLGEGLEVPMRLNPIALFVAFALLLPLRICAAQSQGSEALDVDLLDSRFNGKRINEITLDEITDWLGRPSGIVNNKADAFGVDIFYHDYGLGFNVRDRNYDEQQHCVYVYVYLSKQFDRRFSKYFLPYKGTISKNINGSWKAPQVKSEFGTSKLTDYHNDEHMKNLASIKDVFSSQDESSRYILTTSRIDIRNEISWIIIVYEPNTKFLEWLRISSRQPKTQEDVEKTTTSPTTPPGPKHQKPKSPPSPKVR
jgi:hypothetical protein